MWLAGYQAHACNREIAGGVHREEISYGAHKLAEEGHAMSPKGSHVARRVAESAHAVKPRRGIRTGKAS